MRGLPLLLVLGAAVACASSSPAAKPGVDAATHDSGDDTLDAGDDAPDAFLYGDAPTDSGDGGICHSGLKQSSAACTSCQDAHCCITATACATTHSTWDCSGATVCRQNACGSECATPPATCGNIVPSPASCTDALRKACCQQMTACGDSDECLALVYSCIDGMNCDPSQSCFIACRMRWPAGAKIFDAMNACSQNVSCP
jgi:hypothetical protein